MKTFKDTRNREWKVSLDVATLKDVKDLVGVDLMGVLGEPDASAEGGGVADSLLVRLATDPALLCDVLFAVCKQQAEELGVSDVDFGRAMAGDVIDDATKALTDELTDFFPRARRAVLRKALDKYETMQTAALAHVEKLIDGDTLDRMLDEQLAEHPLTTGGTSGGSPDSSASPPGR